MKYRLQFVQMAGGGRYNSGDEATFDTTVAQRYLAMVPPVAKIVAYVADNEAEKPEAERLTADLANLGPFGVALPTDKSEVATLQRQLAASVSESAAQLEAAYASHDETKVKLGTAQAMATELAETVDQQAARITQLERELAMGSADAQRETAGQLAIAQGQIADLNRDVAEKKQRIEQLERDLEAPTAPAKGSGGKGK